MKVDFHAIECASAFDHAGTQPIRTHDRLFRDAGAPVRSVELRDVLYLPNVLERGQSLCLIGRSFVPEESVLDRWAVEFVKESRRRQPPEGDTYAGEFDVTLVDRHVCILGNVFSRNFGHWSEELLKVAILEESAPGCCYAIADLPPFAREFLLLLGVDDERILAIERPTLFSRVSFTTAIHHRNIARYSGVLFQLRDLVQSRLDARSSGRGARLWLDRGAGLRSGGVTANQEEVASCIQPYGFAIVDPATLSVKDQLALVGAAAVIAGPHGSQFVLAQFMPASSTVIECFSPIHVNPSILEICRVLRHSYHQIVARSHLLRPHALGRDCEVDCEHLRLVLDSLPAAKS